MLGRKIEINDEGITWEGDPRHQVLLEEHFGMCSSTKLLTKKGYPEDPERGGQQADEVPLTAGEAKTYRMLAART